MYTKTLYRSTHDFWKIDFEKSSRMNLIFLSLSNLTFTASVAGKIQVRNKRKRNKLVQLDFSNSIFQKSSTDQ